MKVAMLYPSRNSFSRTFPRAWTLAASHTLLKGLCDITDTKNRGGQSASRIWAVPCKRWARGLLTQKTPDGRAALAWDVDLCKVGRVRCR